MAADIQRRSRRKFLKGVAATAVGASITGCNGNPDDTDETTSTGTPEDTTEDPGTTTTEDGGIQLDIQNKDIEIVWSPDMNQRSEIPDEHTAQATVSTSGDVSLDDVNVILENGDETRQLEPDSNGNLELPADQLQEGETTAYATNGSIESNQETVSKQVPGAFRVDFSFAGEGFDDGWDTVYAFDDQEIDLDALDRWHTNDFDKFGWPGFVSSLTTDGMPGEPYSTYPNWSENSYGSYKASEWLNADSLEEAMEWWADAFLQYSSEAKDGVSSSNYDHMAVNLEESYERHKDRDLHAWGFNSPVTTDRGGNHGSVLVQDWETDTLYTMFPTNTGFTPLQESMNNLADADFWHPLIRYEGEDPDEQNLQYHGAKEKTEGMLISMVSQDFEADTEDLVGYDNYGITDEYMLGAGNSDGAINVMREEEKLPETTLEHMQSFASTIVENYDDGYDDRVLMYGDMDNPRVAVGDIPDELWNGVKHSEQTYTADMVENALAS